jgi:hypothetical protein
MKPPSRGISHRDNRRHAADRKQPGRGGARHPCGRSRDPIEGRGHGGKKIGAIGRELEVPADPLEQLDLQGEFQCTDLVTDRSVGDIELVCCQRQRPVARSHLEGTQWIERGKASGHRHSELSEILTENS